LAKVKKSTGLKIRFGGFNRKKKKTRQGSSRNTKLKPGQKKYRGQGR
jgi:hypothetical protein